MTNEKLKIKIILILENVQFSLLIDVHRFKPKYQVYYGF